MERASASKLYLSVPLCHDKIRYSTGGRLFKIIQDGNVPRGTVRFEPTFHGIKSPGRWTERIISHNVYVNPKDIVNFAPSPYTVWVDLDGTLRLEAV